MVLVHVFIVSNTFYLNYLFIISEFDHFENKLNHMRVAKIYIVYTVLISVFDSL